ncbi:MAG: RNA-binding protein [Candidatus Dadabacteria bacterium]|nr:MAG: RNA-binding protein [Candidatus Dadabacteria bacterium]
MTQSIYVGNLPYSVSEPELRNLFEQYGEVENVNLIMDRDTGRPRGFAFVTMSSAEAATAIGALNGTDLGGRTMRVNEAQPRR